MPLAVGNWWEYEVRFPQRQDAEPDTLVDRINLKTEIKYENRLYTVFGRNVDMDFGSLPDFNWLVRNGRCGLYNMGGIAETDTMIINELAMKFPGETGENWQMPRVAFSRTDFEFYISETVVVTLVESDVEVETPAGTFNAWVYHFEVDQGDDVLANAQIFQFFSPGTGLIKQEDRFESTNELRSEMILTNYQVN